MILERVNSRATLWVASAALVSTVAAYAISNAALQAFIENSGVNIPTGDVVGDYAWGLIWACLLLLSIFVWPVKPEHKKMLAAAWLVKCFVTLVVMLPYEQRYYGADCWTYFQLAHRGLDDFLARALSGGSELIVVLGALYLKIGPDSYHAMKVSFSLIGLLGVYGFYRAVEILLGRRSLWAFWVLMLYPSVLFWSSILGKDPIVLAAIALHVWGLIGIARRGGHIHLAAILSGIALASAVRIWMGPILILPCLLVLWVRVRHIGWRVVAIGTIAAALTVVGPATIDRLQLDKASDFLGATRSMTSGWDRANSALRFDAEINSFGDLLLFTPQSMFAAYFRPLPGDVANAFGWLAGFENLGLLGVCLWSVLRLKLVYFSNHLFLWAVALLLTWGLAYSLVAYKDLGTAVRFKLQILPVLLGLIGFLIHRCGDYRVAPPKTR